MKIDTNAVIIAALSAPGFWKLAEMLILFIREILTGKKKISNEDIADKLDQHGRQLDQLEKTFVTKSEADDEREAKNSRRRILRADDEIRMGMRHSKDFFDDVLRDIDYYENYCDEHRHFKNSCAESAIRNVRQTYDKCKAQNDFL